MDTGYGDGDGFGEGLPIDPEYPPPPHPAVVFDSSTPPDVPPVGNTAPPLLPLAPVQNLPPPPALTPQLGATVQPQYVPLQQQLEPPNIVGVDLDDELLGLQPVVLNNPTLMPLGPVNPGLLDFLRMWALFGLSSREQPAPQIRRIQAQFQDTSITRVEYAQLKGDDCDFQGIDWTDLGVTANRARKRRHATYKNYVNIIRSDWWHTALPDRILPSGLNLFRFTCMDIRRDVRLLHFQLRNSFACSSRTRAFYPSGGKIKELDPTTGRTKTAMNFAPDEDIRTSTLTANEEVLIAGGFFGEYRFRSIHAEDRAYTQGRLTEDVCGITNHVQIHPSRRSDAPMAAFISNDYTFRTVDLTTNKIVFQKTYEHLFNCSAISADRRLRVVVGDHTNVFITDAETGDILQSLDGHRDFGFACDWAPDGWTVATGFQDKSVRIWDARKWKSSHTGEGCPVKVLRMDMSGARSLRFSPLGSGKRVLVAAEEADVISIIDAQTFNKRQRLELLGEIGGTCFADRGQVLMALVCDPSRGGVVQLGRCDAGAEDVFEFAGQERDRQCRPGWRPEGYDWLPDPAVITTQPGSEETLTQKRRKAASLGSLDPF